MARVEFGGDLAARLRLPDALQAACRRRPPVSFVNQPFVGLLQRLPFQQADPICVLARELEPERQALRRVARQGFSRGLPLGDFAAQHFAEQTLLVTEIMVEHPFVDGRAPRNRVHARAGKTVGGEFLERGGQDAFARAFGIAPRRAVVQPCGFYHALHK